MNILIKFEELLNMPSFAYFMGLLFADGYIHKKYSTIVITTTEPDQLYFENIFNDFCEYKTTVRQRHNWKPIYEMFFSNRELRDFLWNAGFNDKLKNGINIMDVLPKSLHYLFVCGFFDGDGCVFLGKSSIVNFSGNYYQDWGFLKRFCFENEINFRIRQVIVPETGNKFSEFIISQQSSIDRFYQLVYCNSKFGFQRKKEKFIIFKKQYDYKIENPEKWKNDISGKIQQSQKKFWNSVAGKELKEKMSVNNTGDRNPMYGKKISQESVAKIADKLARPFRVYDPEGTLHTGKNISQFARDNGLDESSFMKVIRGVRKHHKGWTIKNDN